MWGNEGHHVSFSMNIVYILTVSCFLSFSFSSGFYVTQGWSKIGYVGENSLERVILLPHLPSFVTLGVSLCLVLFGAKDWSQGLMHGAINWATSQPYIYIYWSLCVCVYVMFMCVSWVYVLVCLCVWVYIYMVYTCLCFYVCVYVCVCLFCVCICVYVHVLHLYLHILHSMTTHFWSVDY